MTNYKKLASSKAGLSPGTVVYVGDTQPKQTAVITHIYDAQHYQALDHFNVEKIDKALKAGQHVWVDVSGLKDSDLITSICNEYGIHPLVIEDLLNTEQRPKLDIVDDYLFIVFKLLEAPNENATYATEQFCLLIKQNLLLTVRESNTYDLSSLYKRLSTEHFRMHEHGSDYITYLIMDYIVDDYFNFVEAAAVLIEEIEDQLIKNPESIKLSLLYTIKRRTLTLRKTIAPLRDIVHLLLDDQGGLINKRSYLYFRDLDDHCIRLVESIDLHREISSNMLDIYLSISNNRMNQTMKILTMFASIFIPLTFIVGVYGMNFQNMPELRWQYGYPAVMTGMAILAGIMLFYFKRKKLF